MANEWAKLSTANLEMLKLIPEKKPVLDVMHNGTLALVAAHEDIDLVKLLLEGGADANFGHKKPGWLPLLEAANQESQGWVCNVHPGIRHFCSLLAFDR